MHKKCLLIRLQNFHPAKNIIRTCRKDPLTFFVTNVSGHGQVAIPLAYNFTFCMKHLGAIQVRAMWIYHRNSYKL